MPGPNGAAGEPVDGTVDGVALPAGQKLAQALLQTTYLTVENVAQQCGYSDTGSFRKVFVRLCGVTPGVYRARFRLRTTRKQWLERTEPG